MYRSLPRAQSVEDKAASRCQEAVRFVQVRTALCHGEGFSYRFFFGNHDKEVDMYIALEEDALRREVHMIFDF